MPKRKKTRIFIDIKSARIRKAPKKTLKETNKRVKKLEQRVGKVNRFHDVDDADIYTTPHVTKLSILSGDYKEGYLKQIDIKGVVELTADKTDSQLVRIVLVRDKYNSDPDNDTPTWSDVFREQEIFSHRATDTDTNLPVARFAIVYDKVIKLERDLDGTMNSKRYFRINKRYKNLHVVVDATVGTARYNGFYLMAMSTALTTQIGLSFSSGVTYDTV